MVAITAEPRFSSETARFEETLGIQLPWLPVGAFGLRLMFHRPVPVRVVVTTHPD